MKKYLPGILAIVLASVLFSFSLDRSTTDSCSQVDKHWFICSLECGQQTSLSVIRNALNYTYTDAGEGLENCSGETCVCAIFACPVWNSAQNRYVPVISSGNSIYTELANWWNFGSTNPDIWRKDAYVGKR